MAVVLRTRQAKLRRPKLKRPPKYGNKKVLADGITFDSEKEWLRYLELTLALKSGLIADLKIHPSFDIVVNGEKVCTYVSDFSYKIYKNTVRDGETLTWDGDRFFLLVVEDVKGVRTPIYRLKKKLFEVLYGINLRES